jgi:hypothetical protein
MQRSAQQSQDHGAGCKERPPLSHIIYAEP